MLMRCLSSLRSSVSKRGRFAWFAGSLLLAALPAGAQTFDPTLTVGAGIQGSYVHTEPNGSPSTDQFQLNHLRLYFSGDITKNFSAMVNTDYSSSTDNMQVLDAVGMFHTSPKFNIWFG